MRNEFTPNPSGKLTVQGPGMAASETPVISRDLVLPFLRVRTDLPFLRKSKLFSGQKTLMVAGAIGSGKPPSKRTTISVVLRAEGWALRLIVLPSNRVIIWGGGWSLGYPHRLNSLKQGNHSCLARNLRQHSLCHTQSPQQVDRKRNRHFLA